MLAVCFVTLYPMWFVFVNSLNSPEQALLGTTNWLPKEWSLASYRVVFDDRNLMNGFIISTMRTLIGTSTHVLFTAIVAYGMSKTQLIGRKVYMKIALITMLFSGGLIPTFLLMVKLGLYNHFLVFIIPGLYTFFNMVIFMIGALQVFDSIVVLTQGGPGDASRSLVMYIYEKAFQSFDMGYASAVAITLFVMIMALTLVQFRLGRSWVHYE